MKRVSRWLARVCMAAVLFGAVGLEAVSVNESDQTRRISVESRRILC